LLDFALATKYYTRMTIRISTLMRFSLIGVIGFGAMTAAGLARAEPLYQIEVLVFARSGGPAGDETWFPADSAKPPAGVEQAILPTGAPGADSPLRAARQALQENSAYRVLAYKTWTQDAPARAGARAYRLRGENDENPRELDGTARFYTNKSLIMELDLALEGPDPNAGFLERLSAGDKPVLFRIRESRRMRARDTHYFDHPVYGALVRITPSGGG
jgi:hypothetical protein